MKRYPTYYPLIEVSDDARMPVFPTDNFQQILDGKFKYYLIEPSENSFRIRSAIKDYGTFDVLCPKCGHVMLTKDKDQPRQYQRFYCPKC